HPDPSVAEDESELLDLNFPELALLKLEGESISPENLENLTHELEVLFHVLRSDQNIVHVRVDLPSIEEGSQDVVDHRLKCCRRIGEPEEHDQRLEETPCGPKSCLPFVTRLDPDVVVPPTDVKLGEVARSAKPGCEVRNEGKR